MWEMTVYQWLILVVFLVGDVFALKDVDLTIRPRIVERAHQATLECSYDLEGAGLYYVKWYRGTYEFYRYTPSEVPTTKVFAFGGINVDVNLSNSTQVVLTDIDFQLSGNFSCEVTTAEEPARTGTADQSMLVVQLPVHPPKISVGREILDYGHILRANCTSPPARPPAILKFVLNNLTVAYSGPLPVRRFHELHWSDLALELELAEYHFTDGKLILRCVAQIEEIYHEEAVLKLNSARQPISERVSASNSGHNHSVLAILQVLFFVLIRTR